MSDPTRTMVRLVDGRLYDPWEATGEAPSPETVAYGLARLCRYGGHVRRPGGSIYSVGEHCLWVSLALSFGVAGSEPPSEARGVALALRAVLSGAVGVAGWWSDGWLTQLDVEAATRALCGLVHDAPEGCGLVDIPGPIRRRPEFAAHREADDRCLAWLCGAWGVLSPQTSGRLSEVERVTSIWAAVWAADRAALSAELAIRPERADGREGWPWIDLTGSVAHPLAVERAWIDAFKILKARAARVE